MKTLTSINYQSWCIFYPIPFLQFEPTVHASSAIIYYHPFDIYEIPSPVRGPCIIIITSYPKQKHPQ